MERNRILVVDDDPLIRGSLYEQLKEMRFNVEVASDGTEAMEQLKGGKFQLVLTDLKMPQVDGLSLLEHIKNRYPDINVVLITGFGNLDTAVGAFRNGAFDFLTKPIQTEQLEATVQRALATTTSYDEPAAADPFSAIVGHHASMEDLRRKITLIAQSPATVLLRGESGTGKRVIAHAIHRADPKRCKNPFVEVSCGALPETLLESELFGHVRGSFTGAIRDKEGRFEVADGGTILLDEVDTFSPAMQVKVLRVIQDRTFERVGDNRTIRVDVRIIAATNRNLDAFVKEGKFREDLYHRLNVISLHIPPLRERASDVPILVEHFLKKISTQMGRTMDSVTPAALDLLRRYPWPGNVRELENAIERAIVMNQKTFVDVEDLPDTIRRGEPPHLSQEPAPQAENGDDPSTLKEALRDPEREIIMKVLKECGYNRSLAAKRLGIHRATLYHKLKRFSIDPDRLRSNF
ncbi:MAG: sigma-54 dependent transcriptional regulator [Candidatus Omnitrophica bacterium]|nr:sigma-54 dependent transcriptional regulator [Candidatus Omnitrophota bacterium]